MNVKYEIAREYNDGFLAGITPAGFDESRSAHWSAGYSAGYEMRSKKNDGLNNYLVSVGAQPMSTVRLAGTKNKE